MEEKFGFAASVPWYKARKGFTLAEILIVLAVIGVVMAITVPTVTKSYEAASYKASFEYAFAFVSRSIKKMNFEEGKLPTADNYPSNTFKPSYIKYVKLLKDCGMGHGDRAVTGKGAPCVPVKDADGSINYENFANYKTYNSKANVYSWPLDDGQFILLNGMYVFIENNVASIYVSLDINGYVEKPNMWGYDLFTFQLMRDGTVRPMGASGTDYTDKNTYCSKTSTNNLNGIACAYQASIDPNYFKSLF